MEDNNQQIEIRIPHEKTKKLVELTTPKEIDSVETSIQEKVGSLDSSKSKCCIYKVPEFMQKDKEDCYRPLVISIGPVFCKDAKLQTMQELKWIYMDSFLRHPDNACGSLDSYISKVRELNVKIRGCYQEQGMIACENDDEFIEVIVFDAVFLVYLIKHRRNTYHPIPQKLHTLMSFLERDIFLEENQVPYFVLQHIFVHGPLTEAENHSLVSNFLSNDGWDFSEITLEIPTFILNWIRAMPLTTSLQDSLICWNSNGLVFDSRGMYNTIWWEKHSHKATLWKWNLIWDCPCPPKLKNFLWLAAHNSLPSKLCLSQRGINTTPFCPFCPTLEETNIHLFRDCPRNKDIWDRVHDLPNGFFSTDWNTWLQVNLEDDRICSTVTGWNTFFVCTLWKVWIRRNKWVFQKEDIPANVAIAQAKWQAQEFNLSCPGNVVSPTPVTMELPTDKPHIILVDASFSTINLQAGCAGTCLNPNSQWKGGFVWSFRCNDATSAELIAIHLAFAWAVENGWMNCYILTDSKIAAEGINGGQKYNDLHTNLVTHCREALKEHQQMQCQYISRTTLMKQDHLAKQVRLDPTRNSRFGRLKEDPFAHYLVPIMGNVNGDIVLDCKDEGSDMLPQLFNIALN